MLALYEDLMNVVCSFVSHCLYTGNHIDRLNPTDGLVFLACHSFPYVATRLAALLVCFWYKHRRLVRLKFEHRFLKTRREFRLVYFFYGPTAVEV